MANETIMIHLCSAAEPEPITVYHCSGHDADTHTLKLGWNVFMTRAQLITLRDIVDAYLAAMEPEPDPPCTCTRVDVDRDDARGCELHDERSEYNREARRLEAEKHPAKVEESESGDCPF